jgi:hypothetical protein
LRTVLNYSTKKKNSVDVEVKAKKKSNKEQNDIITEGEEHVMIHDVENNISEVQLLNSTSEITGPVNAKRRKRNKNSSSMEQNDIITKCEVTSASSIS